MKRLRDMARFECEVRVLRNGFCGFSSSSGDIKSDTVQGDKSKVASWCQEMYTKFLTHL